MTITQEMITHNGSSVMMINLPRLFDSNDLAQRLSVGARRAYASDTTFRAVLDFNFVIRHLSSFAFMYGQLDDALQSFPRDDLQYRIAIVVDDVADKFVQGTLDQVFSGSPQNLGDWVKRVVSASVLIVDGVGAATGFENLPSFKDPWIKVHQSRENAIHWCVQQAPWP